MVALLMLLVTTTLGPESLRPEPIRPPDCLYVAYGCEYYIWDMGGGRGEALVTCDGGGTFSAYVGAMGNCPDQ